MGPTWRVLQEPLVLGLRCHCAVFKTVKWGGGALFNFAKWGGGALSNFAKYGGGAVFKFAKWGGGALFNFVEWVAISNGIFLKTERANLADIHDPPLTHPPTSTVKPQGVGRSKMDQ